MKIFQRILHAVAVMALVAVLSLLASILLLTFLIQHGPSASPKWFNVLFLGPWILLLVLIGLGVLAIVKKLSWKILLPGLLVVIGVLLYLRWDREEPKLADLGPRVTASDEGYRVVMWMAKDSPFSRLSQAGLLPTNAADLRLPTESKDWPEHIRRHRDEIMRAWDQDVLGREWIDAINAHPPAGVWPQGSNDPLIQFRPIRASTCVRAARAYALAMDGNRDEAIRSLIPMISAWQHVQQTGPCLLNAMIACVVLKQGYSVAGEILKLGDVSIETKAMLAETLSRAPAIQQTFRNAILGEQDFIKGVLMRVEDTATLPEGENVLEPAFESRPSGGVPSRFMTRCRVEFLFNRNWTEREHVDRLQRVCAYAEARQLEQLRKIEKAKPAQWVFKNPVGTTLLNMATPAFAKVAENFWKVEDQRQELLKQLSKL
jgi:hypothetical protein